MDYNEFESRVEGKGPREREREVYAYGKHHIEITHRVLMFITGLIGTLQ